MRKFCKLSSRLKLDRDNNMEEDNFNKLRLECWDDALHSFGTGYLYSLRGEDLKRKLKIIDFIGVVTPASVGGVALGYGLYPSILAFTIPIAVLVGIVQLIFSIWSITSGWSSLYPNYLESVIENAALAIEYENLAKFPPNGGFNELKIEKEKIDIKRANRDKQDNKNPLSEKEKRKGMRWALRKYQRACAGCNIVPVSMESTKCNVCGNFE